MSSTGGRFTHLHQCPDTETDSYKEKEGKDVHNPVDIVWEITERGM